jgi:hypothetical protein
MRGEGLGWLILRYYSSIRLVEPRKGKVVPVFFKLAPHYEGVLGSGGISPRILDIGTRWK